MKKALLLPALALLLAASCSKHAELINQSTQQNSQASSQEQETVPLVPNQSPPNMSSWKTYKSDKLGFQVQYPADFELILDASKFPAGMYKGAAFVLQKTGPNGEIGDSVAFRKDYTSLKAEISKYFSWTANLHRAESAKMSSTVFIYDYQTASLDESRVYLFPYNAQSSPDDDGSKLNTIIVAEANAGITDVNVKDTAVDFIVGSLLITD